MHGRDDSEVAVLPTMGFGPTVTREATVRCVAERLQSSALYRPVRGGRSAPELYISVRPSRWQRKWILTRSLWSYSESIAQSDSAHP